MKSEDALGRWSLYSTLDKIEGGRDFQGKVGNLKVGEKEQTCGKQILAGSPRNDGAGRGVGPKNPPNLALLDFFCHS